MGNLNITRNLSNSEASKLVIRLKDENLQDGKPAEIVISETNKKISFFISDDEAKRFLNDLNARPQGPWPLLARFPLQDKLLQAITKIENEKGRAPIEARQLLTGEDLSAGEDGWKFFIIKNSATAMDVRYLDDMAKTLAKISSKTLDQETQTYLQQALRYAIEYGILGQVSETWRNMSNKHVLLEDKVEGRGTLNRPIMAKDLAAQTYALVAMTDFERVLKDKYPPKQQKLLPDFVKNFPSLKVDLLSGKILALVEAGWILQGSKAEYDVTHNVLFLDPSEIHFFGEIWGKGNSAAVVLHELYHAYQDKTHQRVIHPLMEASAHWLAAFYFASKYSPEYFLEKASKSSIPDYSVTPDALQNLAKLENFTGLSFETLKQELNFLLPAGKMVSELMNDIKSGTPRKLEGDLQALASHYRKYENFAYTVKNLILLLLDPAILPVFKMMQEGQSIEFPMALTTGLKGSLTRQVVTLPNQLEYFEQEAIQIAYEVERIKNLNLQNERFRISVNYLTLLLVAKKLYQRKTPQEQRQFFFHHLVPLFSAVNPVMILPPEVYGIEGH